MVCTDARRAYGAESQGRRPFGPSVHSFGTFIGPSVHSFGPFIWSVGPFIWSVHRSVGPFIWWVHLVRRSIHLVGSFGPSVHSVHRSIHRCFHRGPSLVHSLIRSENQGFTEGIGTWCMIRSAGTTAKYTHSPPHREQRLQQQPVMQTSAGRDVGAAPEVHHFERRRRQRARQQQSRDETSQVGDASHGYRRLGVFVVVAVPV